MDTEVGKTCEKCEGLGYLSVDGCEPGEGEVCSGCAGMGVTHGLLIPETEEPDGQQSE